MKHGFLILTHFPPEKIHPQVLRLQHPDHYFFIHFDAKIKIAENDTDYNALVNMSNVVMIERRTDVKWGGFSILTPIFGLVRAALQVPEVAYLHLLSAECLHVKSIKDLHSFFERNNGKEYISYSLMPKERTESHFTYRRIDKYHLYDYYNFKSKNRKDVIVKYIDSGFRVLQRALKVVGIYRRYPDNLPVLYAGPTWWSLTRNACQYMVNYIDDNPAFYNRFAFTQLSDEIVPQTLMMHSPYKDNVVNDFLRYIYFEKSYSAHPVALTMEYLPELMKENVMFARKFTPDSKELLEYMDKHIYNA